MPYVMEEHLAIVGKNATDFQELLKVGRVLFNKFKIIQLN